MTVTLCASDGVVDRVMKATTTKKCPVTTIRRLPPTGGTIAGKRGRPKRAGQAGWGVVCSAENLL